MKTKCDFELDFYMFFLILEPSWDPRSTQNGRKTASKNRASFQHGTGLVVGRGTAPWRPPTIRARRVQKNNETQDPSTKIKESREPRESRALCPGSDTLRARGLANLLLYLRQIVFWTLLSIGFIFIWETYLWPRVPDKRTIRCN